MSAFEPSLNIYRRFVVVTHPVDDALQAPAEAAQAARWHLNTSIAQRRRHRALPGIGL